MGQTPSSYTFALSALLDHIRETGEWVVVAVADVGGLPVALQKALTAIRPPDAEVGGRTLLLPEGGRLTVTSGSHLVTGEGFQVMFLGYDGHLTPRDEIALHSWRQKADATITLGERAGELRINS
jgi:hypothetical protein